MFVLLIVHYFLQWYCVIVLYGSMLQRISKNVPFKHNAVHFNADI